MKNNLNRIKKGIILSLIYIYGVFPFIIINSNYYNLKIGVKTKEMYLSWWFIGSIAILSRGFVFLLEEKGFIFYAKKLIYKIKKGV